MIIKRRPLAGINKTRYVEESMVTFLANFSEVMVDETEKIRIAEKLIKYMK